MANTGTPSCPKCRRPMKLRTAKRGSNSGSQFWGCSTYPSCNGTRDLGAGSRNSEEEFSPGEAANGPLGAGNVSREEQAATSIPVEWTEGVPRYSFNYEYAPIGSVPGVLIAQTDITDDVKRLLSHTLLLTSKSRRRVETTEHARLTSGLLAKLLQRGYAPLATLEIERAALNCHGLMKEATDLAKDKVEVGWQFPPKEATRATNGEMRKELIRRDPWVLDIKSEHSLLQSDAEVEFLTRWVPSNLGLHAAHWFTPQAPLDRLLESADLEHGADRRIDFLVCYPGMEPFAVEIDGPEHIASQSIDDQRDKQLRSMGVDVIRVSNAEVELGDGPRLNKIKERFDSADALLDVGVSKNPIAKLAVDCSIASKIQFAIARAVNAGWLADNEWEINLSGTGEVQRAGVLDALRLLSCFDVLYGGRTVPKRCTVRDDEGTPVTWVLVDGEWIIDDGPEAKGGRVSILVQQGSSPFSEIASDAWDIIIRPAFLPVNLRVEQHFGRVRQPISTESFEQADPALTTLLRTIFRKYKFRQQQGEAVFNTLQHNDTVVLLPTGAGKSIVYQLAGLLMPGITIVVDPIVALIEDQVQGLRSHGIERAAGIVSSMAGREERSRLLRQVERGEYQFVLHSPERLQTPDFRSTLQALREISLVNLAVIDESHCVSEWGHDFRPAYLNLANNLRRFAADSTDNPPPLLALTGTASRAVLRDMLTDLGIDQTDDNALIRPESFDRKELSFDIRRATVAEEAQATLRGVLNGMAGRFGTGSGQFYRPNGRETASGVIFTRNVNARLTGLIPTRHYVWKTTGVDPAIYSGGSPRGYDKASWDDKKRENATAFKGNEVPILVATKAFGMGIDKPNIRYIVHYGMPDSLESFYQEAGRAGRDQQRSHCVVVFTEYDSDRSDSLLDPSVDLNELARRFKAANRDRSAGDDVTSAMWFHLRTFSGPQTEIQVVENVLRQLDDLSIPQRYQLACDGDDDRRRKEHAVVRLLRVGVLRDYEVEFGSARLTVQTEPFDFERCRQKLLDYVQTAQPHRSNEFRDKLSAIVTRGPHSDALTLARLLIEFTYDVIERSRRRATQESVLLARSAQSDAEIRTRLMDYLQEGLGAERIGRLLERRDVRLAEWWELIEAVQTPMDAGELRGLCIRALESAADHPGLLFARAAAEAMCHDHNDSVTADGIETAVKECARKGIPESDTREMLNKLYDLAQIPVRAVELGVPLAKALCDAGDAGPEFAFCGDVTERRLPELQPKIQDDVRVILDVYKIGAGIDHLTDVTEVIVQRYNHSDVVKLLGGSKE